MALLTDVVIGAPLDGTAVNNNWHIIEASLADIGPLVISGLVPTPGTGLSVDVSAGDASIGGRLTVAAPFTIGSLAPSTTNHLYLLNTGAGASNTTGVQPANSVKLGTALTGATTVTSVSIANASKRQLKVNLVDVVHGSPGSPLPIDLGSWNLTSADGFQLFGVLPAGASSGVSAPLTLTLDDASSGLTTYPLRLRHTTTPGPAVNGIGVGMQWDVENTGGGVSNAGWINLVTQDANFPGTNGKTYWEFQCVFNNAARTIIRAGPDHTRMETTPPSSANVALLSLGPGGFAGGAGNFAGSGSGTILGANQDSGQVYDYLNFQSDGILYAKITGAGVTEFATWDGSGSGVSQVLTVRHMKNTAGAAAAGIGARIQFENESDANDVANIAAQIDGVLTTVTNGAATGKVDVRVNNAGTIGTPLSIAPASLTLAEGVNLFFGTSTGTKIGSATAQKIGFWNATPAAQQVLATGASHTVDDVIGFLQSIGLCRQS